MFFNLNQQDPQGDAQQDPQGDAQQNLQGDAQQNLQGTAQQEQPPAWVVELGNALGAIAEQVNAQGERIETIATQQQSAEQGYQQAISSLVQYGIAPQEGAQPNQAPTSAGSAPQPGMMQPPASGYIPLRELDVLPTDYWKQHGKG